MHALIPWHTGGTRLGLTDLLLTFRCLSLTFRCLSLQFNGLYRAAGACLFLHIVITMLIKAQVLCKVRPDAPRYRCVPSPGTQTTPASSYEPPRLIC